MTVFLDSRPVFGSLVLQALKLQVGLSTVLLVEAFFRTAPRVTAILLLSARSFSCQARLRLH